MTNKYGVPDIMVRAMNRQDEKYSRAGADFSATQLLNSPYIVRLKSDNWRDIQEDAIDKVYAFRGHMAHHVMELAASENEISEERIEITLGGVKISGKADLYSDGIIYDLKTKLCKSAQYPEKEDVERQLNIYAYMYADIGFPVGGLQVISWYLDWEDPAKANPWKKFAEWYPPIPFVTTPVRLWDETEQRRYIEERVKLHAYARTAKDPGAVPVCTSEERWSRDEKWAVMAPGKKRAVALYTSSAAAEAHADSALDNVWVEHRPGSDPRCERWCKVKPFCRYAQERGYV